MGENPVGVIGLGSIGGSIALCLVADGLQVVGFDSDAGALKAAEQGGITAADSPAAVAQQAGIILLSLPDSDAVEQVCLSNDGIINCAHDGLLVIDASSGYPQQTREIGEKLATAGIAMIDAAITAPGGGANMVNDRNLTFIVGGDETAVTTARPLLERLSDKLFHVGPLGAGQTVKLVNNMSAGVALIATLEGLQVASKHGLDLKQNLEVMRVGTGHTAFARFPQLFDDRRRPGAHIGLMMKDLEQMSRLARESRIPSPVGDLAAHQFRAAAQTLGHDASIMQIADVLETWSGVLLDFDHKVKIGDLEPAEMESIQQVGIIGLGNIGEEICKILIKDGLEVFGHDIDAEKIQRMTDIGVKIPGTAKAVAESAGLVILALPQSAVVEQVLFETDGVASANNPGLLVIDTTSGYPDQTREFADRLATHGITFIDAAITGERGGSFAIPDRNLTFIVGGNAADVRRARNVLDRFCSHLFLLGPLGAGQIAKMVNNMVCAVTGVALLEGLLVAARHGIDYQAAAEALDHGTGANFWTHNRVMLNPEPMKGGFFVGLMTKDLRQMSQISHVSGVPNMLGELTYHLYQLFSRDLSYYGGIAEKIDVMQRWAGITLDGRELDIEKLE
ncbi:MAG: hypothetical protein DRQ54_01270 [Gammaproteobacteria bacterium]|nr:MAG: hypothetical protein DRQ54_01270 [Gammaproteobacteria bacterium]RLA15946.1 MAG: hypothetical protein DRQ52_00560 [Gammaproteobacteria bacterium]